MYAPHPHLVAALASHAQTHPDELALRFLVDGETCELTVSYAELDHHARAIAAALTAEDAIGERVLLLYPPGIDYVAALYGCMYAGAVAVPLPTPDAARSSRALSALTAAVDDCEPAIALSLRGLITPFRAALDHAAAPPTRWIATDDITAAADTDGISQLRAPPTVLHGETVAMIHYTAGATGRPRGVIVCHRNLAHNLAQLGRLHEIAGCSLDGGGAVTWMPPHRGVGLIAGLLHPIYNRIPVTAMSPTHFHDRPQRWPEAIARFGATASAAPADAYALCAELAYDDDDLDLSRWRLAMVGSQVIQPRALRRFVAAYDPAGFAPAALCPVYELAEGSHLVTAAPPGRGPDTASLDAAALARGEARPSRRGAWCQAIACGYPAPDQRVAIVAPETLVPLHNGEIGEIWLSGPSVAGGYWGQLASTEARFAAYTADGDGPFLRTGDAGFVRGGQLWVVGRLADRIAIGDWVAYPELIEGTTTRSDERLGASLAFPTDSDGVGQVVVVAEVAQALTAADATEIEAAVASAVETAHGVALRAVSLIRQGELPRTPDGKLCRADARAAWLAGTLTAHNAVEWAA